MSGERMGSEEDSPADSSANSEEDTDSSSSEEQDMDVEAVVEERKRGEERRKEEGRIKDLLHTDMEYFKMALDLIPTQFYFNEDTKQMLQEQLEQQEAGRQGTGTRPEAEQLSEKALSKRRKFDPTQIKTVTELQAQIVETQHLEHVKHKKKYDSPVGLSGKHISQKHRDSPEHSSDSDNSSPVKQQSKHKHKHKESYKKADKSKHKRKLGDDGEDSVKKHKVSSITNLPHRLNSLSHDDARQRLHQKLQDMQAKRSSLNKSDVLEKRKLKRRESKTKLKMRRKSEKESVAQKDLRDVKTPKKSPAKKPIYNKEGKMVFSKFDFTESRTKEKTDAPTGKNYKQLLDKVQRQKDKLEKLKETNETKAKEISEKNRWKTVIQKAEGVRVKDNPELLKKALKKKEKDKERRKSGWGEREDKLKAQMKERQDKRRTNIQKRKKQRVDKKIDRQKKKGRIIPGF